MGPKRTERLTGGRAVLLFAACWAATFVLVLLLRQVLIPAEEMACYKRVDLYQGAVDRWNKAHPDKPVTEDIDEAALAKEGFLQPQAYDHEKHYYFVGKTAHGPKVKCNKHEDNPLLLRLTGDTVLAVLVFAVFCMFRGYRLPEAA